MKTFVICLDSFKPEYLKSTPFLRELTRDNSWGSLETVFGYTGIGAAIISGKYPEVTGIWREFCFSDSSPFKLIRYFESIEHTCLGKVTRLATDILFNLSRFMTNHGYYTSTRIIPFSLLPMVEPAMRSAWCQKGCLPVETIFDYLREKKTNFFYHDWPSVYKNNQRKFSFLQPNNDKFKVDLLLKEIPNHDFFWIRLWNLDSVSHNNDRGSKPLTSALLELDNHIKGLFTAMGQEEFKFLLWSDHGMVKVTRNVDVSKLLSGLESKFLVDSTSIRFYNVEPTESMEIMKRLKTTPGYFLDEGLKKKYKLGKLKKYGELFFLANPGVCFLPNNYSVSTVRGMHGYDPKIPEQKGIYLTNMISSDRKDLHITDLFQVIKSNL
ncbi:hypothetical protein A2709_03440 [candidate division WWE3 bacterium RIFCSPHIGHO2_01_FULL_43_9]|uniref:Phosphodiesterase n=1 Tax=candidate division WWE3 bacterium RIFCSPHIGHO2_01_FULL_43_9 TaxID=1802618 RepID=A0A1F4V8X4_UNCKA|nr:MAG: hypothetical protein A2709_03440 [candidate division WWE3 bacterium RIFCSPHIGHO2_01_FULL_43_9]